MRPDSGRWFSPLCCRTDAFLVDDDNHHDPGQLIYPEPAEMQIGIVAIIIRLITDRKNS